MSGKPTKIDVDKDTQLDVRCQVYNYHLPLIHYLNFICFEYLLILSGIYSFFFFFYVYLLSLC